MKLRCHGALASAVLIILSGAAQAKTNDSLHHHPLIKKPAHHAMVHRAPPRTARRAPRYGSRRIADAGYARSYDEYYDYYDAREVREGGLVDTRSYASQEQQGQGAPYDSNARSYYDYGNAGDAPPPNVALNGRDFNGGVGYGQNGDMGHQGGYGWGRGYKMPGYNMNGGYDMNGGDMNNADAARFSVWHGYNSRNGLGNGY